MIVRVEKQTVFETVTLHELALAVKPVVFKAPTLVTVGVKETVFPSGGMVATTGITLILDSEYVVPAFILT